MKFPKLILFLLLLFVFNLLFLYADNSVIDSTTSATEPIQTEQTQTPSDTKSKTETLNSKITEIESTDSTSSATVDTDKVTDQITQDSNKQTETYDTVTSATEDQNTAIEETKKITETVKQSDTTTDESKNEIPDMENRKFDPKQLKQTIAISDDNEEVFFKKKITEVVKKDEDTTTQITDQIQKLKDLTDTTTDQTVLINKDNTTDATADLTVKKDETVIDPNKDKKKTSSKKKSTQPDFTYNESELVKKSLKTEQSSMILFNNQEANRFNRNNLARKDESDQGSIYYEKDDFVPENINDFQRANPAFITDSNGVVLNSSYTLSSELGESLFQKALSCLRSGQLKSSRMIFEKLVYYNYKTVLCYYYSGIAYTLNRDYFKAIHYQSKAYETGSLQKIDTLTLSGFLYEIAMNYNYLNNPLKMEEYLLKAVETDPFNASLYNSLGIFYINQNQTEKAVNYWKKGVDAGDRESMMNYQWFLKQTEP